ncbi:MAG: ABC transporter ATP-binding protein [Candidatus Kryptoniota bacterium]
MLEINNLSVKYGAFKALDNISLKVPEGKIVSIVGANGAGKTTLLKTISGLLKPQSGSILFRGCELTSYPAHKIVHLGVVQVPEGRKLFPEMTVLDNLLCGGIHPNAKKLREQYLENAFALFPRLHERKNQQAKSLSGGEQQMLAIARGLVSAPMLLMLDEPSLGLAPIMVKQIFEIVKKLNASGLTILLVEQNVHQSLLISDYAYVLETGRIVLEGEARNLLQQESVRQAYLGI